jgi:hypothetical protein
MTNTNGFNFSKTEDEDQMMDLFICDFKNGDEIIDMFTFQNDLVVVSRKSISRVNVSGFPDELEIMLVWDSGNESKYGGSKISSTCYLKEFSKLLWSVKGGEGSNCDLYSCDLLKNSIIYDQLEFDIDQIVCDKKDPVILYLVSGKCVYQLSIDELAERTPYHFKKKMNSRSRRNYANRHGTTTTDSKLDSTVPFLHPPVFYEGKESIDQLKFDDSMEYFYVAEKNKVLKYSNTNDQSLIQSFEHQERIITFTLSKDLSLLIR